MKRVFIAFVLLILIFGIVSYVIFKKDDISFPQQVETLNEHVEKEQYIVVAAGDIACDYVSERMDECRQKETSDIALEINPDYVFVLGDLQYPSGSLSRFRQHYDASWGRLKSKTYPAIGNHEYLSLGGRGYFDYFGPRAGQREKGYYSYTVGNWHIISLNSNCWAVGGCDHNSVQGQWLREDLVKNQKKCTLAFWHSPLYSTGMHGNDQATYAFWQMLYESGAEIILSGHDHNYQRYAKITQDGVPNEKGIRQFVVGTGGRSLYQFKSTDPNIDIRDNTSFGVLKLTLLDDGYEWEFVPTLQGGFRDKGKDDCV